MGVREARIELESAAVMAFRVVRLSQAFIGDRQATIGGGVAIVQPGRALEQGKRLAILASLNFHSAAKVEYIRIVRRPLPKDFVSAADIDE